MLDASARGLAKKNGEEGIMATRTVVSGTRADKRIERIRALALKQPHGLERSLYGFPVFSIGRGKVFL